MSRTVFILGAGASVESGAPLMVDFIREARQVLDNPPPYFSDIDRDCFKLVFLGLDDQLQRVRQNAEFDTENIEDVFAAFEMAALVGSLGSFPTEHLKILPPAMRIFIARTLEETTKLKSINGKFPPPKPCSDFVEYLLKFSKGERPSIITFNYDLVLDYALHYHGIFADYDIPGTVSSQIQYNGGSIKLFKLHGSLNWARCESCNTVFPWHMGDWLRDRPLNPSKIPEMSPKSQRLFDIQQLLLLHQNCKKAEGGRPMISTMIVPPTWNKTEYRSTLGSVWEGASQALSKAENIVVTGYSFPRSDLFFKHLYAIGTLGSSRFNRFRVLNTDSEIEGRFVELLGTPNRRKYKFDKCKFSDTTKHDFLKEVFR